jgi:urease accessory protein
MDAATVVAMLLADSRFPAGTYAHSLGLEQAVADGLGARDLPRFAADRLRLVGAAEARVTVAARRAVPGGLDAVAREWAARCPNHVLRGTAMRLGGQLLRTARTVWPSAALPPAPLPRPVALGAVCAAAGLDDERTAAVALYDDAATVTSAALKVLPLDPALATRWLAELAPVIGALAARIAADGRPLGEQPGPAAPALDAAAIIHHSTQGGRLFVT